MDDPRKAEQPDQPLQTTPVKMEEQREEGLLRSLETGREEQRTRRDELRASMLRSIVTEPLFTAVQAAGTDDKFDVIIALNEFYRDGMAEALHQVEERAKKLGVRYATATHYVFACLTAQQIRDIASEARELIAVSGPSGSVVYRIWEDPEIHVSLVHSATTVKADAAQRAFRADGRNVVWAVLDSGIDGTHPHFKRPDSPFGPIDSLAISAPLGHVDFTPAQTGATIDGLGHGTHVAGIIAGYWASSSGKPEAVVGSETRDEASNNAVPVLENIDVISGIAPRCSLVSLKVIADTTRQDSVKQTAGQGKVSWVLQAIDQIQQWNQYGRRLLVHGVNMSLGYDFDPRWFGCGQSPICVEVNRLVKCGVSVVVSAGNAGYSAFVTASGRSEAHYSDLTIGDPGNAELAITVGSTHRDMPHLYGISYFSSRGPTGDGRMKPDLVAPGERIVSCAAGAEKAKYAGLAVAGGVQPDVLYCEQTGTSMAAPHVSGAIAAFLSVRAEFIGQPERVKELVVSNTVDLRRERAFQGAGLLDLMKVLQAV